MIYEQQNSRTGGTQFFYYQDRNKKWKFHTNKEGVELLLSMVHANQALLEYNETQIKQTAEAKQIPHERVMQEGRAIYADKNSMKNEGVTWSIEEYGHLGLQAQYLRLKSFQRFTETWTMLERAERAGVFRELADSDSTRTALHIASIGGGPAYELLAFKQFFQKSHPAHSLAFCNLDVQEAWRPYSELLGFPFRQWDINDGNLLQVCEWDRIDYVLISYVLIHVAKTPGVPQHEAVCDMLANLVKQHGVRAIVVCERSPRNKSIEMVAKRDVCVLKLLSQRGGVDDRQTAWLPYAQGELLKIAYDDTESESFRSDVFPNVPYEEFKKESRHPDKKQRYG